jgi:hypothetical protein
MTDAIREEILRVLAENGVPVLEENARRIAIPAPEQAASTALFIDLPLPEGAPVIRIHAPVLLEVPTTGTTRTKALDAVNRLNGTYPLGKLVYYEGDESGGTIVYEHALPAEQMAGASLVRLLVAIGDTADTLDDVLLDHLGVGRRFKDMSPQDQAADVMTNADQQGHGSVRALTPGTFLRWKDQEPGAKPLGIVLAPVSEDMIQVLMADHQGNTDVEVFVARREDTGVGASQLVQESLEIVDDGDPKLMTSLRELASDHPGA